MQLRFGVFAMALLLAGVVLGADADKDKKDDKKPDIDPAVEKALKAAGWTSIKGSWKMVKPNIYEVTDGKLETNRADGTLSLTVDSAGNGTVCAYVRNSHEAKEWELPSMNGGVLKIEAHSGYGVEVDDKKFIALGPKPVSNKPQIYVPVKVAETKLQPNEKVQVNVSVHGLQLEVDVNGKTPSRNNYNISKDGPFAILVVGTATIEAPTVKD